MRQSRVRIFVEADLSEGVAAPLSADQAHYLTRVMRLTDGAPLVLFNGRDGEWSARLAPAGKGRAAAVPDRLLRPQAPGPDVHLLCAPIKRQPFDLLIQKATELGVAAIRPVLTDRTVPERVNLERLRTIAAEAAEQCERLDVPAVDDPAPLASILAAWNPDRRILLCDERGAAMPLLDALTEAAGCAAAPEWAIVTGPEGGFSGRELDALRDLPFVTSIGLGPRILRAETAAIAALAVWQAVLGDWAGATPDPFR